MTAASSQWKVGDLAIYGKHGLGRIDAVDPMIAFSVKNCRIQISPQQARISLRPPCDEARAQEVLAVISAPKPKPNASCWATRIRAYRDLITQNIPEEIAQIYRELGCKQQLTASEKLIFQQVRDLLVADLTPLYGEKALDKIKEAAQRAGKL